MTRRYVFALVDGGGNVPPELSVVRRLVQRGHAVTVLAEDSVRDEVRATGATLRRWAHAPNRPNRQPENDPVRDWECRFPWQLVERLVASLLVGPASRYAQDVKEAVAASEPDLVLSSMFCIGGMVAAEAAGCPFDVLIPNVYPLPAEGLPPFGLGLQPARGPFGRKRDHLLNAFAERLWDYYGLVGLNRLRAEHGLVPLNHLLDQARRARRHLVLTSPAFDFKARVPSNARYVGPVLDDPIWAEATSWMPPAGTSPLVLVAMSSTFQEQTECLQHIVDALGTLPVRGVVTTGPAIEPGALRAGANVTVVPAAAHRQILPLAALVVTHGGHGTVMKALAAGVPLVVLPHGRDQADTAARVTARGAGIALNPRARPRAIADAMRRVLRDESYRRSARQLGELIRRDASGDSLIGELEDVPPQSDMGRPDTHVSHRPPRQARWICGNT